MAKSKKIVEDDGTLNIQKRKRVEITDKDLEFKDDPKDGKKAIRKEHMMTPREIHACELYLKGMSLSDAMRKAGYNPSYCEGKKAVWRFLKNRVILTYLRKRKKEISEVYEVDRNWIARRAKKWVDEGGIDRVKAAELLERLTTNTDEFSPDQTNKGISINFNVIEKNREE